jgi:hypothetical protein
MPIKSKICHGNNPIRYPRPPQKIKNVLTMKKNLFLVFFLIYNFLIFNCFSQEYLWPIKRENTSEGIISVKSKELDILYRPDEYIDKEHNFATLFLTAPEGTTIVSPVDGTVILCNYGYFNSICSVCNFGSFSEDFEQDKKNIVEYIASGQHPIKKLDVKYLSLGIYIQTADGRKVDISGLRPVKQFKSGEKIKKGDVIGTMGYSYKAVKQPSIRVEVATKKGTSDDPMTPFGLKSTFKKPEERIIPTELTVDEAKQDYEILIGALKEGHPGLYDYISEQDFENHISTTLNSIPSKISMADFERLVIATVNNIRDSHTAVISQPNIINRIEPYLPTVGFGWLNDSLVVCRIIESEKKYFGKKIIEVDGIPTDSLKQMIRPYIALSEGFIENYTGFDFLNTVIKYFEYIPTASRKCDVTLTFTDGTKKLFKGYKSYGQRSGLYPAREELLKFLLLNQSDDKNVTLEMLSDSVAYVGISTFNMNDLEFDELTDFMKSISKSDCPYLIVDVRNNPGGDCTKFFSYIAQKPFKIFEYIKVNKQDNYEFLQYSLNYTPDLISFSDFLTVEGKSGFFSFNNDLNYPDTSVNYKGRVYILTNERSYSASSDLAALIMKNNRGAVVGRETGSSFYQMNARESSQLRLPNSWIVVHYPLVKFVFESQLNERIPWGRGVLPDFPVPFTLEEITFENGDIILNYTLQLIQDGVYIDETDVPEDNDAKKVNWILYLCTGLLVILGVSVFLVYRRKGAKEND